MGTIVTLPAERRRRRASVRSADGADILLFMGVRYVRDAETLPVAERPQPAMALREDLPFALA